MATLLEKYEQFRLQEETSPAYVQAALERIATRILARRQPKHAGRFCYTPEHLKFLRQGYQTMTIPKLTEAFNAKFRLNCGTNTIKSALNNHKITCGRKTGKERACRVYTPEQAQWLKDNHVGRGRAELAERFTAKFGREITVNQVKSFVGNRKLNSGLTGHYAKGQTPWNRGKKGYMGANITSFKKGNIPHTQKPLYSERVNRDGYMEISIPERNPWTGAATRFKHKHVYLWEQEHGPLPKGHAVIFRDCNNRNFELDNLLLVTRTELLHLNLHKYSEQPDEIKPSILALAKLEAKAGFRSTGRVPGAGRKKKEDVVKLRRG